MMKNDHIIYLLEQTPPTGLTAAEISLIEEHSGQCLDCRQAYMASVVSSAMIRSRASEEVQATQFFKTRVMSAIREQRARPVTTFGGLWKAAGILVSSMMAVVALLITLTLFSAPGANLASGQPAVAGAYGLEQALVDDGDAADESLPDAQIIDTLFNTGGANGSN
jgi:hypothetical protein